MFHHPMSPVNFQKGQVVRALSSLMRFGQVPSWSPAVTVGATAQKMLVQGCRDLAPGRYNGPAIAADAVEKSFPKFKEKVVILDVAAGTGFLGVELAQRGYHHLHALDPSEGMLRRAQEKNVYDKFYCDFLTEDKLPIKADTYDCIACAGGFGQGHIPSGALWELLRITKPGGVIVIVMREEYLKNEDYKNCLEPLMHELHNTGKWMQLEKSIVPKYFCDKEGVVYRFRALNQRL